MSDLLKSSEATAAMPDGNPERSDAAGSPRVDLAALRALLAASSPAPWMRAAKKRQGLKVVVVDEAAGFTAECGSEGDAAFIVALRNELPALLDELESKRAIVAAVLALYAPVSEELLLRWLSSARPDPIVAVLETYHRALTEIVSLEPEAEDTSSARLDKHMAIARVARDALGDLGRKDAV